MIEKKGQGGNGVGGFNAESTDESILITDEGKDTKDFKVNWTKDPTEVTSEDGSILVNKGGRKFDLSATTKVTSEDGSVQVTKTGNTYDVSVPLATEEQDGRLSKSGKYQIDHSQLIETDEMVDKANTAASILMTHDLEYYPTEGQMMTWRDLNGKLHLSRYEPNTAKNNGFLPSNWRTAVWDDIAESIIVESKSGDNTNPASGKFRVSQSFNGGWTWTPYLDEESPNENWGIGCAYNGTAVFISRNLSREVEFSTDGGVTWTRSNLPSLERWNSVWVDEQGRFVFHCEANKVYATSDFGSYTNVTADYPTGVRCYFLPNDPTRYPYTGKTSNWMCMVRKSIFGMESNVLMVKTSSGWQNYYTFGSGPAVTRHFPIKIQVEASDGTVTKEYADLFVNDEGMGNSPILYINGNWEYQLFGDDGDWWVFPVMVSNKDSKVYCVASMGNSIYDVAGNKPNGGSTLLLNKTKEIIRGTEAVNFIPYGHDTDSIFTFGGVKHSDAGYRMSSFNLFLTIDGKSVLATPPDFWREIPLLDENKTGLVYQEGNDAKTLGLGNYLEKRTTEIGEEIGTIHSDRTTKYENYQMRNSNGVCWVQVPVASMVNNSTKVYSDEACTDEIGVVTNHNYNLHNPYDVEVSIDGVTMVFVIDESKYPYSLATTRALIDGLTNIVQWIANNITNGVGNAVWESTDGAQTWTQFTNISYMAGNGFYATIPNNLNDYIVVTNNGQQPAVDRTNWVIFYTCVQVSGTFTTYIGCRFTDGQKTDALVLSV